MRFIGKCTADAYARSFWVREYAKHKYMKRPLPDNPLEELKKPHDANAHPCECGHPYKLPGLEFRRWGIWELTTPAELEALLVIQDPYMRGCDLIVNPPTLGNVTRRAIETDYFTTQTSGTQLRLFNIWRNGTLRGRIVNDDRLCLRALTCDERLLSPSSTFYIVDGWGRSLPYLTLVYHGHEFFPIEVYLAE